MTQLIFTDNPKDWQNLLPLTFTKPIASLRIGILTIKEKWQKYLQFADNQVFYLTESYLQAKYLPFPQTINNPTSNQTNGNKISGNSPTNFLYINNSILPDKDLVKVIKNLPLNSTLVYKQTIVAIYTQKYFVAASDIFELTNLQNSNLQFIDYQGIATKINFVYDIFKENRQQIIHDFALVTANRQSLAITDIHTKVYGAENIFLEEGATIKAAILNAEDAPIYLGSHAKVHEGAIIKGAFALCEGAEVNMAAKIKGDTTVGIFSKVGGEVSNSVIMGYSNKGHDGFLGNSVIGEWCNLGADTNTSNLKNNYSQVKLWNFATETMLDTDLQFCGTIMGDHAKCSINTMLNTGTVIGIGANIFGADFPPKFVPPFAWGSKTENETFAFDKFCEMATRVMQRRGISLEKVDVEILETVFKATEKYRKP